MYVQVLNANFAHELAGLAPCRRSAGLFLPVFVLKRSLQPFFKVGERVLLTRPIHGSVSPPHGACGVVVRSASPLSDRLSNG